MGPVADLRPRRVAAQPLQPDRAEAAVVARRRRCTRRVPCPARRAHGCARGSSRRGRARTAGAARPASAGSGRRSRPRRCARRRTRERPQHDSRSEQLDGHQPAARCTRVVAGHRGYPAVHQRAALIQQPAHRTVEGEPGGGCHPPGRPSCRPSPASAGWTARARRMRSRAPAGPRRSSRPARGPGVRGESDLGPAGLLQPQGDGPQCWRTPSRSACTVQLSRLPASQPPASARGTPGHRLSA